MPAVKGSPTVLVTGASGFIATWIVKTLLDNDFSVRGTVRTLDKGVYLKELFGGYGERFSYILVEDMCIEGAYDEAVKGVDAILHTASPVVLTVQDPQDLIKPAVTGTLNILESAKTFGLSVKRIVITSSCATIAQPKTEVPPIYTEEDWNDFSVQLVEKQGFNAPQAEKYRASKVLAERAAWEWIGKNKGVQFDIVTILPSFVLGPLMNHIPSAAQLNSSTARFYDAIKNEKSGDTLTAFRASLVDVRDVALVHMKALGTEEASGGRFIATNAPISWQTVYDALNSANIPNIPKGVPGAEISGPMICSSLKAQRLFGVRFRNIQETIVDTYYSLEAKESEW